MNFFLCSPKFAGEYYISSGSLIILETVFFYNQYIIAWPGFLHCSIAIKCSPINDAPNNVYLIWESYHTRNRFFFKLIYDK
jgi:hypothetical protein